MSKKQERERFLNALTGFNTLTRQNRFGFLLIAAGFSVLILVWFLFHITHGILYADEAFYLTIADRLAKGDKLILDEWQLSQFTVFFQYLPYRLYVLLTGSNDGVILYMRYLYTFVHLLTYWYIIFKLKKHPLQAIASAFLFCSFVPLIYALNYYTLPIYFILYVCLMITDLGERFHRLKLIFIGILIACTVLTSPGFAVIWLIYAALCFAFYISEKKGKTIFADYAFVLNTRTFGWILIGILIPAAAFLVYMQLSCGWGEIIKAIPYLLTDPEYDSSAGGNLYSFFWSKLWKTLIYYNLICSFLMLMLSVCIVVYRKKILCNIRLRIVLFLIASCLTVFMQLYAIHKKGQGNFPSVFFLEDPAFLLTWLCFDIYFLSRKKDRKTFLFWIAGVALSTVKDALSDISFGESLIICVIPLIYMLPQFIDEITADVSVSLRKGKNARGKIPSKQLVYLKKGVSVALSLLLAMTAIWIVTNKYYISVDIIEKNGIKSCTERIEKGPHKGIYTSKDVKEHLSAYFNDMDRIAAISEKAPHITGMMPYAYLYLDRPYPIFSTYLFASDDMKYEHRTETYWQLHPDKRPDIIYMPAYAIPYQAHPKYYDSKRYEQMSDEEFASFDWFEGTAIKGEGGVIFQVSKWKQPETWD